MPLKRPTKTTVPAADMSTTITKPHDAGGVRRFVFRAKQEPPDVEPFQGPLTSSFAKDARRLGLPIPLDVKDASKMRFILMSEERQRKMKIEREVLLGYRIPLDTADKLLQCVLRSVVKELETVRAIFEDMPEIDETTKRVLRVKAREWCDRFRETVSSQEIVEADLTPKGIVMKRSAYGTDEQEHSSETQDEVAAGEGEGSSTEES